MENNAVREMSFGEKAVGLSFNPGASDLVHGIKTQFAQIIDLLNDGRQNTTNGDVKRMYSEAITNAQTAQMWAVKAATWRD
jgi:hypothetical protein